MRFLDRWVGVPISVALTGVRRLSDLIGTTSPPPTKILIIKLVEQGATVIAVPAIRRAIQLVGRENVYFAVFEDNRPILDLLDLIPRENILVIRSNNLVGVAIDTLRAIFRSRREHIDTAIDFEFFSRFSGALAYLSGASRRVGFHSFAGEAGYRGDLMTHRMAYNIRLHASETYLSLVEAVKVDPAQLPMLGFSTPDAYSDAEYHPDSADVDTVRSLLRSLLPTTRPAKLLLINANSGDLLPIRRWPDERYVELARRLLEQNPDLCIALTGAPSERAGAERLAAQIGSDRCVSVAGQTTLPQLFALYTLSDVMVTNDSGPAHYAALTPIDVVTLFGPESPLVFGARNDRSHLLWAGLACSPCVNAFNQRVTTCRYGQCMQAISVNEVFAAVSGILSRRTSHSESSDATAIA